MSENLEKRIRSRSIQKHDLEVNWNKATSFVPYKGEFIIYDIEVDEDGNNITQIVDGVEKTVYELVGRTTPYTYERIKLGDGKTKVSELPFIDNAVKTEIDAIKNGETFIPVLQMGQEKSGLNFISESGKWEPNPSGNYWSGWNSVNDVLELEDDSTVTVNTWQLKGMWLYGNNYLHILITPQGIFERDLYVDSSYKRQQSKWRKYSTTTDIADVIKSSAQNLTEAQKAQARINIGAATPSEITSQVTTLSNQLYDTNYGTESGMSIRYIASQVVKDKAVSLAKGTRKNDLNFTYTNGTWNISPIGNYYGSVTTSITIGTYTIESWIIKGIELADGGCKQTLISDNIKLSRYTNTDNTWTDWKDENIDTKTSVTVGGSHQETFDADTKLSVQSSYPTYGVVPKVTKNGTMSGIGGFLYIDQSLGNGPATVGSSSCIPTYKTTTATVVDSNFKDRVLLTGTPTKDIHCANKTYVDSTFVNKAGDIITGDLTITGNLQIKGISETVDAVTYKVENNLIEFNPNKTYNNTWLTGIAVNKGIKNETDLGTYGIMYDPHVDSVKLGFGTISENHTFTFNENESAPIATREEFNDNWEEDEIFVFDKATKKFKHSGKTFTSFEEEITAKILTKMRSEMNTFVKDYVENYMSYTEIEHEDGTIDTISDILFVENYTEKQNGTELWVEEN